MSTQKTILVVTPYFPPDGGGLERYAFEIALWLKRDHGWRVVFVTSGTRYGKDEKSEAHGFTIYRLAYRFKFSNSPFSFGWHRKACRILQEERPDIINIHTPVPGIGDILGLLIRKTPLIVTYHTGSMRKGKFLPDVFIWFYEHFFMHILLRRAQHIVCSSDFVRLGFLHRYLSKSTTITPAVDTEMFKPDASKKTKERSILFVAGLSRAEQHKGLKVLIDAVKKLQETILDIRLVVVGDGDMRGEYEEYVCKLSLENRIIFRGKLAGNDLVAAYQEAHVFALPTANDSFPMTIIEAMACGLPVVSTTVGNIPLVVEDGKNGFLVSPDTPGAIADKIFTLLRNPSLVYNFGNSNYNKAKKEFDWQIRTKDYCKIFEGLGVRTSKQKQLRIVMLTSGTIRSSLTYRIVSLARQLVARGHTVTIVAPTLDKYSGFTPETFTKIDGVHIVRPFQFQQTGSTTFNWIPYIFSATWYMLTRPADIIYLYKPTPITIMGLLPKLLWRTPVVVDIDDLNADVMRNEGNHWLRIKLVEWCEKLATHFANSIVVVSTYLQQFYRQLYPGKSIIIIPNGSEASRYSQRNKDTLAPFPRIIVLAPLRRTDFVEPLMRVLPKIVARLHHERVHVVVMGDGICRPHFQQMAKTLGLEDKITFVGWVDKSAFNEYIQKGDIGYCFTADTQSNRACSNQKVFDYMALGVVPVVSMVGDLPEYVDHGRSGYIVPTGDESALADTLIKAIQNTDDRHEKMINALERVAKHYDWSVLAKSVEKELLRVAT